MDEYLQKVTTSISERFGAKLSEFRGQARMELDGKHIVDVARVLKEEFGFEMMTFLTAVDYWPEGDPRFHVVYQFTSYQHNQQLLFRVPVGGENPTLPTIVPIYPSANWHERETFDMFGIRFEGHPDLRRLLMPHDWVGHPLRKDYPLGYEEVAFTFNFEEIHKRKPKPAE